MKKLVVLFCISLLLMSCKKEEKTTDYKAEELDVTTSIYPENITQIFEAHGGIDAWNAMKSMAFTMPKESGDEVTLTNLNSRKSLITMPNHTIGYDGAEVWLQNKDTTSYKGNAKFYYNLMFYFYAMPFILADDGIIYKDAEPLVFEGKSYPGILISYESGIGESPEDEYILYYDEDTNQMAWLGYTVTYFTKEKGKEFHFIRYADWQTVEGLALPKTMHWYNYENNLPTTKRNEVEFTSVTLSKEAPQDDQFNPPDDAQVIE